MCFFYVPVVSFWYFSCICLFFLERNAVFSETLRSAVEVSVWQVMGKNGLQVAEALQFTLISLGTPIWGRFPIWRTYFSIGLKPPTRSDLMEKPTLGQVWVWAKRCAHHFGIAQVVSSYRCLDAKDEHFMGWKGRNMTLFVGCWLLVAGGDWLSGSKIGWSRVWFRWIEFMQQKLASHFTNKNHLPSPAHL